MRAFFLALLATVALVGCGGSELTQNDLPVQCLDKPEPGPCKSRVIRYFYDYRYDSCRPFHYGGCQGRVPFETKGVCEEMCVGGGK
jgi:hypothetical protein